MGWRTGENIYSFRQALQWLSKLISYFYKLALKENLISHAFPSVEVYYVSAFELWDSNNNYILICITSDIQIKSICNKLYPQTFLRQVFLLTHHCPLSGYSLEKLLFDIRIPQWAQSLATLIKGISHFWKLSKKVYFPSCNHISIPNATSSKSSFPGLSLLSSMKCWRTPALPHPFYLMRG